MIEVQLALYLHRLYLEGRFQSNLRHLTTNLHRLHHYLQFLLFRVFPHHQYSTVHLHRMLS
jgi:hypothetical protein